MNLFRLDRPPFSMHPMLDPAVAAQDIVDSFACLAGRADRMAVTYEQAMRTIGIAAADPLHVAGMLAARDIDAGVGAGMVDAYHNTMHYCEVMLCCLAIGQLAQLTPHEQGELALAALLHDFHHDGGQNQEQPFRLETLAVREAAPYLQRAGVTMAQQRRLTALILATDRHLGVPFALACHAWHAGKAAAPAGDGLPPDLLPLREDGRGTLLALALCEADVLPSAGLTFAHACINEARLAREWGQPVNLAQQLYFIDRMVGELQVATYFMPNVRALRQAYVNRG